MKVIGLKVHVVYNLDNMLPTYFEITGARTNDINVAKNLELKQGVTYVADKGYTDYNWWYKINQTGAFFVTRLKHNAQIKNLTEKQFHTDKISSQIFVLTNKNPRAGKVNEYANIPLRKVYVDRGAEGKSSLVLLTLKIICTKISTKNLLKIIGNSLFNCLKVRKYGRCKYKNPNQLQFEWVMQC